jgi:hypothetical protein
LLKPDVDVGHVHGKKKSMCIGPGVHEYLVLKKSESVCQQEILISQYDDWFFFLTGSIQFVVKCDRCSARYTLAMASEKEEEEKKREYLLILYNHKINTNLTQQQ